VAQQVLGPLDPAAAEVPDRGQPVGGLEAAGEVVLRHSGYLGQPVQVERGRVVLVDVVVGSPQMGQQFYGHPGPRRCPRHFPSVHSPGRPLLSYMRNQAFRFGRSHPHPASGGRTGGALPYFVGVDVGGTGIKAGLFAEDLGLRLEFRVPTPREDGPGAVVAAALAAVTDAVARGVRQFGTAPAAVGLAVLGLVDEAAGVAKTSAATGWRDVPLRALVEESVSVPVGFGHDLRAAALAEARLGAGRGLDSFLFVAIGTGIGSALVLGGQPLAGAHGRAGEIGHVLVRGHDDPCSCGGVGCLEAVASARAVAVRYGRRAASRPGAGPRQGAGPGQGAGRAAAVPLSAAQVAELVKRGDPDAVAVWSDAVEGLAEVLAGCVAIFDPAALVIGGGLAKSGEQLLAPLRSAIAERLTLGAPPPVAVAALGDRAALVGAGLLARQAFEDARGAGRR
jgi:glucokinase